MNCVWNISSKTASSRSFTRSSAGLRFIHRLWFSLIHAKKRITPETALQLEVALDISADFWLNAENQYRLRLSAPNLDLVAIRTRREVLV